MGPLFLIILLFMGISLPIHGYAATQYLTTTEIPKTFSGQVDMCLACHFEEPDKAHGRRVLGCFECHLGNPLSGIKETAHQGMVKNPGELFVAPKTCGQTGCHVNEVNWVKNSLMATNRGIISTLRYYWGEATDQNENITTWLIRQKGLDSPAIDYFRKMCGSCHLGLEKGLLPDFLSQKGGGCTACHNSSLEGVGKEKKHAQITKFVPMKNCVKCHNRSGRIGLSYQGMYETEGYGTPFIEAELAPYQLEDGRFYLPMRPDVHHSKGLICIDCHTQKEVMGDGHMKAHIEEQLEIECTTCHQNRKALVDLAKRDGLLHPYSGKADTSKKPLSKIDIRELENGRIVLMGKADKKPHPLRPPKPGQCNTGVHSRLSCQACHATWVPQCYGCHVRADKSEKQLDKLNGQMTFGNWTEFRSFIRYERPVLGVRQVGGPGKESSKIVILVPG